MKKILTYYICDYFTRLQLTITVIVIVRCEHLKSGWTPFFLYFLIVFCSPEKGESGNIYFFIFGCTVFYLWRFKDLSFFLDQNQFFD